MNTTRHQTSRILTWTKTHLLYIFILYIIVVMTYSTKVCIKNVYLYLYGYFGVLFDVTAYFKMADLKKKL